MYNAVQYSHYLLNHLVAKFPTGLFIDATIGKGYDISYLLNSPVFKGFVIGFDIQLQAIELTKNRLNSNSVDSNSYQLIHDSHHSIDKYLNSDAEINAAIFNLGYLPGADHQITTQAHSTIQAIQKIATKLVRDGQIILVIYHGHAEGKREKEAILSELAGWPQKEFHIIQYKTINQINNPPFVIVIEKK